MQVFLTVFIGALLYTVFRVIIAVARMVFSKSKNRKQDFKETFWTFFLEMLNPLNWLSLVPTL